MRWVTDYRRFAEECRRLAAVLTKPADKRALELMAKGWDKAADAREAKLHGGDALTDATREPRQTVPSDSEVSLAVSPGIGCDDVSSATGADNLRSFPAPRTRLRCGG